MSRLQEELLTALGEDDFIRLAEAFGGLRLYVPGDIDKSELPDVIGGAAAMKLSKLYPGGYIRVPLAREIRAARYRASGASNRDIAHRLRIAESSVDKIVRRGKRRNPKAFAKPKDTRQLDILDLLDED
ncbi:response regulator transcription factor [Shinella sp. HZN7]|uniref:response regulator transcription factor n=1 Tax=Shinella sp. (strain HZN7) TaxID=879274 RepID=UPI0007DA59F2|nr:response regulator transcription factor [Shinella sp. HZN7]ANH04619.1 hypothetical protein shn_11610 [Shinella sp. HZN7]